MGKKLLVFALTFCLSLVSFQLINQYKKRSLESLNQVENFDSSVIDRKQFDSLETAYNVESQSERDNRRFGIAGVETDKEVKDFYLKFQKAVAEDDKNTVALLMIYPLRVFLQRSNSEEVYTFISNKKLFLKAYDKIFDKELKELIAQIDVESVDDFWAKQEGVAIRHGEIWMGVICHKKLCKNDEHHIKIATINGVFPKTLPDSNDTNKGN